MPKVRVDKDEYFPFYRMVELADHWGIETTVQQRTLDRWERAMREFGRVQKEMSKAYNKSVSGYKEE